MALAAVGAKAEGCLSPAEVSEAVRSQKIVTPGQAVGVARSAVPNAEVLRAWLCREPDALVYRLTVLRQDGRMVRVTVDGSSGRVRAVH